jgi:hypothetical protein
MRTVPFPHDLETPEQPDLSITGDIFNTPLHLDRTRASENPRRVLQVHQDDVDPVLPHQGYTAPDRLFVSRQIISPKHGVWYRPAK